MQPHPDTPERRPRMRKRMQAGGHAKGPDGEPLCGAQPQELRFSDPPSCSQCTSVLASLAGVVKKKKNRVKGKHAKGRDGTPLCGVDAKKAFFAKAPSCAGCQALLQAAAARAQPSAPSAGEGKAGKGGKDRDPAKRKAAKAAAWVIAACPVCDASIPEHRLERHMKKIHGKTD